MSRISSSTPRPSSPLSVSSVPSPIDVYPHTPGRSQSWVRLQGCPRHGELLRSEPLSPRSIFFTGLLLRANREPC